MDKRTLNIMEVKPGYILRSDSSTLLVLSMDIDEICNPMAFCAVLRCDIFGGWPVGTAQHVTLGMLPRDRWTMEV